MSISPLIEQLRTVAGSPYALIGYVVLALVWGFTTAKSIRIKTIARTIGKLPEADRIRILEKEYGYHLKEGMSAKNFLRAQRSTYTFYSVMALIITGLIISVVAILRAQPRIVDSKQLQLCTAIQQIVGQIDDGFKRIRGAPVKDPDDPKAVEFESTLALPNSYENTVDLSENEPSLAATIYYGQDARTAYQIYQTFIDNVRDCMGDWMIHPDLQDSEPHDRNYVSFVRGQKKIIVSLKKYTDESQPRYYVTVLFCRISMSDSDEDDATPSPRPTPILLPGRSD